MTLRKICSTNISRRTKIRLYKNLVKPDVWLREKGRDKRDENKIEKISAAMIQKFTSLFHSDFKSVFVSHLTGKILSFQFYLKAVFFEGKCRISRSAVVHVQN